MSVATTLSYHRIMSNVLNDSQNLYIEDDVLLQLRQTWLEKITASGAMKAGNTHDWRHDGTPGRKKKKVAPAAPPAIYGKPAAFLPQRKVTSIGPQMKLRVPLHTIPRANKTTSDDSQPAMSGQTDGTDDDPQVEEFEDVPLGPGASPRYDVGPYPEAEEEIVDQEIVDEKIVDQEIVDQPILEAPPIVFPEEALSEEQRLITDYAVSEDSVKDCLNRNGDEETSNVVLCQFQRNSSCRVKRVKKYTMKAGVMTLNGKDYLFSTAYGEFEF